MMDANKTLLMDKLPSPHGASAKPSQEEAEAAVRTLIAWAGDDPAREGLFDTPQRVVEAYREWFAGYDQDPEEHLLRTFEEVAGYHEMVLLRDIAFSSHCEHHLAPIIGTAHIAYHPNQRVVGISKMARLVELYARRLQIQEKMTAQIGQALFRVLQPKGVAVLIAAEHHCMTTRGVNKPGVALETQIFLGSFEHDAAMRREFLARIQG
ncbi:MAG: GTP cyclohydrolase I FolE [Candidatus Symbiobacter sp.]|nr:GTP cyclohydrolase I FolE [Candidatus Symbiobacter sp.]